MRTPIEQAQQVLEQKQNAYNEATWRLNDARNALRTLRMAPLPDDAEGRVQRRHDLEVAEETVRICIDAELVARLAQWICFDKSYELSREQIQRILNARIHPDNR